MQDSLKIEIDQATVNPQLGLAVLTVDLQQALPTPKPIPWAYILQM
jgi:hypothetical protein